MSRVGKKPIAVPAGVNVTVNDRHVEVSGPLGKLSRSLPDCVAAALSDDKQHIQVSACDQTKRARAMHGLFRMLIANMVEGVSKGFEKRLLIFATGYPRAEPILERTAME